MRIRGRWMLIAAALVLSISSAAMAVIYSEDFNNAIPGDPALSGYITATGTWTVAHDSLGDGFLLFNDPVNYGTIRYNGGSWSNYYQQVLAGMDQGNSQFAIGGRLNPSGGGYYLICWVGVGILELRRADNFALGGSQTLDAKLFTFSEQHNYGLHFNGNSITAYVDGLPILSGTDSQYSSGSLGFMAGYGTYTWFDNIFVDEQPPVVPEPSSLIALGSGIAAVGGILRRRII